MKIKTAIVTTLVALFSAALLSLTAFAAPAADETKTAEPTAEVQAVELKNGLKEGAKNGLKEGAKNGLKEGAKNGLKEGAKNGLKEGAKNGLKNGLKNGEKRG